MRVAAEPAGDALPDSRPDLAVLVLGCGSIGLRHLRNLRAAGIRRLLVHDPDPAAVDRARAACDARPVEPDGGFGEVDVAIIGTPPSSHIPLALRAARAGCDLFIEKPLSHDLHGVEELIAAARARELVTLVACNMRFHPGPARVKALLEEGAIGRPLSSRIETGSYLPYWRPGRDHRTSYSASSLEGGAVLDCIHELDLTLWYHGPGSVVACAGLKADWMGVEADGLAEILVAHDSGVLSSVHLNFVQRDYRRGCEVIGTDGTIRWDFTSGEVRVIGPDGTPVRTIPQPEGWTLNDMYVDQLRHFLTCAVERRPTVNPLESGAETLRLALAARASMWLHPRGGEAGP